MLGQSISGSEVPQRESEVAREFSKLFANAESIEKFVEVLRNRLQPFLNGGGLKNDESAKNPENSSKFAQELNSLNDRLARSSKGIQEILDRLEI